MRYDFTITLLNDVDRNDKGQTKMSNHDWAMYNPVSEHLNPKLTPVMVTNDLTLEKFALFVIGCLMGVYMTGLLLQTISDSSPWQDVISQ